MREGDEVPPGVDPGMWAAASPQMRNILRNAAATANDPKYQTQAQPQPPKVAAKVLGAVAPGTMSENDIDNAIKSYLGNSESGLVKNLDKRVQDEINYKITNGQFRHRITKNASEARMRGTGIYFFKSPEGLTFIRILPGARAFGRPFGTY